MVSLNAFHHGCLFFLFGLTAVAVQAPCCSGRYWYLLSPWSWSLGKAIFVMCFSHTPLAEMKKFPLFPVSENFLRWGCWAVIVPSLHQWRQSSGFPPRAHNVVCCTDFPTLTPWAQDQSHMDSVCSLWCVLFSKNLLISFPWWFYSMLFNFYIFVNVNWFLYFWTVWFHCGQRRFFILFHSL